MNITAHHHDKDHSERDERVRALGAREMKESCEREMREKERARKMMTGI